MRKPFCYQCKSEDPGTGWIIQTKKVGNEIHIYTYHRQCAPKELLT